MVINLVEHMRIFLVGLSNSSEFLGSSEWRDVLSICWGKRELATTSGGKPQEWKAARVTFREMKFGRCVTVDDGGNYVTFHELNRRLRKD